MVGVLTAICSVIRYFVLSRGLFVLRGRVGIVQHQPRGRVAVRLWGDCSKKERICLVHEVTEVLVVQPYALKKDGAPSRPSF